MKGPVRIARAAGAIATVLLTAISWSGRLVAQAPPSPSIDEMIGLKRVGSPALSPDGRLVAFTVREANWDDNAYETEIWFAEASSGEARQLTNAEKSSQQPEWGPDSRTLAFVSDREGKQQLYRIDITGGEAERLTNMDEGVNAFAWAPDGRSMAFTAQAPVSEAMKAREKRWGDVRLEDEDLRYVHLHVIDLATKETRALTSGRFVVGSFDWSPDGTRIAFDHRVTSDPADGGSADISIVDVASGTLSALVTQEGPDSNPRWSPDGQRLAFQSAMAKPFNYFQNSVIAVVTPGQSRVESLTDDFDENPSLVAWTPAGILFSASQRTYTGLFSLDPATRAVRKHQAGSTWIASQFSPSKGGTAVAFVGSGPAEFPDVFVGELDALASSRRVSDTRAQVAAWPAHTREVIRWKSQDGT
ncbi:MAG: S9 family peptidase, partial [Acidobacteriota bacterium]|nr:S9 family peptidase [Acidobacteriota bacterium]